MKNNLELDLKGKNLTILCALLLLCIGTILLSNIISGTFNLVGTTISVDVRLHMFTFCIVLYAIFQYLILRYVRNLSYFFRKESKIKLIYSGIKFIQYFFISCTVVLLLEAFTKSEYSLILIILITLVGYGTSSIILSILSFKFIYWIRKKSNKTFILYVVSMIILAINMASSLIYGQLWFVNQSPFDTIKDRVMSDDKHLPKNRFIFYIYSYSSAASFILNYFAAMMLLRYYTKKSKMIYWITISIPLLYFISQYTSLNFFLLKQLFVSLSDIVLFYNITYISIESLVGALISISFLVTSRRIPNNKFKINLYLCSIGYTILFSANYAVNISNPIFPPFTLIGVLYVPLSTFLIFVGIYSAASIGANDTELRRYIRITLRESVIENIGTSEVENRILKATKKISNHLEEETGFTSSFEDEDIIEYVKIVSTEIDRAKKQKNR